MSALDLSIFVISVVGIFLEMQQKTLFWLSYIIASVLLGYEFWHNHLYGSSALQLAYIIISIFGWYKWKQINPITHKQLKICYTNKQQWLSYIIITTLIGTLSFFILRYYKDDSYLMDATLTAICLTATYMASLKQIEGWFIFAAIGIVSALFYYHYHLYFTAITYIIFAILDFIGGIKWMITYHAKPKYAISCS